MLLRKVLDTNSIINEGGRIRHIYAKSKKIIEWAKFG